MENTKYLFADDAARYCGIEKGYLVAQAKKGFVPYTKPSERKMMFLRNDLDAWMATWIRMDCEVAAS